MVIGALQNVLNGHPQYDDVDVIHDGDDGQTGILRARNQSGVYVAVRLLPKHLTPEEGRRLFEAIKVQRRGHHPCVLKFSQLFRVPTHICWATEYVEGGNLRGGNLRDFVLDHRTVYQNPIANVLYFSPAEPEIRPVNSLGISEDRARQLVRCLVYGLKHLHDSNGVHRTLKLENIFVSPDGNFAKIGDFIFAHDGLMCKSKVGTPYFMAPEVFDLPQNNNEVTYYGPLVDVWALGCLLYFMIFAKLPFDVPETAQDRFGMLGRLITQKQLVILPSQRVSENCTQLIGEMLNLNVDRRITLDGILAHPWMNNPAPIPADPQIDEADLQSEDSIRQIIGNAANIDL